MVEAWIAAPVLVAILGLGCGALLEGLSGARLPGPVLVPAGLAVLIVSAGFPVLAGATAPLAVPLVVALALAGLAFGRPWRGRRPDRWALGAALSTFAVYAAPFVLAGEPTLGGYIKLDDTASWLAITDRVMAHGVGAPALPPSTYEATLDFYLGSAYPVGGLLPLGVTGRLVGGELAWLWQPYLTVLGATLALVLYELLAPMIAARPTRALAAVVAAQAAPLFGFALWGGFKELATAVLVGLLAVLAARAIARGAPGGWRAMLPLAVTSAAVLTTVNVGGGLWLAGVLVPALAVAVWRTSGARTVRGVAGWAAPAAILAARVVMPTAILALPAVLALGFLGEPAASTVTDGSRLANLIAPLSPLQAFGVWPAADFRIAPDARLLTGVLVVVVAATAVAGAWRSVRSGALGLALFVAAAAGAATVLQLAGSPWVAAKGLAIVAPTLLAAAAAGLAALAARGGRIPALLAGAAVVAGVLTSNVLQAGGVTLAPHDRFAELSAIGEHIAGHGPTLMTDYEPFAARWFLRRSDPEGASELRRRTIPLRSGRALETTANANVEDFRDDAVLTYRTLVLRRDPTASRPPSAYALMWRGRYYDVWQRPSGEAATPVLAHVPLRSGDRAVGRSECRRLARLARRAGARRLVVARREAPIVALLGGGALPAGWSTDEGGHVYPERSGALRLLVDVPAGGRHDVWLGGLVRGRAVVTIDGRRVGALRHQLSYGGRYAPVGAIDLGAGGHDVTLRYDRAGAAPGSAGPVDPLGPLVLSRQTDDHSLVVVPAGDLPRACRHPADWIELLP